MSLLLVSDTHMDFGVLRRMVDRENPSAILHCGDLGFFDAGSWERLSAHERKLILKHHDPIEQAVAWTEGRTVLGAPLFAIPGNHEDFTVVDEIEAGRRTIPGLRVLTPGDRVRLPLGEGTVEVMGLGRVLLGPGDPSPRSRDATIRPEDVTATTAAGGKCPPDILLLHEPPLLTGGRHGTFGSAVITGVIEALQPRLVLVGHMHVAYVTRVGSSTVVGLGYGVAGQYALLDVDLVVRHRDLHGRPTAFIEVHPM